MKASSNLLMRAAAMLLAVSACVALSACTKLPNSSQPPIPAPSPTATAEPSPTPSPSPSPSPSPTPAPILTEDQLNEYYGNTMDFEEYMAEERIYGLSGLEIDDGYSIEIVNNNTLVKREYFGYYNNKRNYGDTVASYTFDEYQQLNQRYFVEDIVYLVADQKTILRIDRNLEHMQVIFSSDKTIDRMDVERDVVYITFTDKSYYLYHIKSKTLHFMYQNEKAWSYLPHSNYKVYANIFTDYAYSFIVNNEDIPKMSREETQNRFLYDTKTKELTLVKIDYTTGEIIH